jgi:hypothetical protein
MAATEDNPFSDYFKFEPLLGPSDPLADAWDSELRPEDYGDQSGIHHSDSWDDDDTDGSSCFSDSSEEEGDDDDDDCENDDASASSCDWSLVHFSCTTTITTTAVATTTTTTVRSDATVMTTCRTQDKQEETKLGDSSHECLPPNPLARRDSKVRFCDQPPQVLCYEKCRLEDYSRLYYSVHELQKIIDDLKVETNKGTESSATASQAECRTAEVLLPSRSS